MCSRGMLTNRALEWAEVVLIAYVFLGLAEVTEDLAHPFSTTLNALPLDAMCRTIEISLAPHLGLTPPPPLLPQDFQLL